MCCCQRADSCRLAMPHTLVSAFPRKGNAGCVARCSVMQCHVIQKKTAVGLLINKHIALHAPCCYEFLQAHTNQAVHSCLRIPSANPVLPGSERDPLHDHKPADALVHCLQEWISKRRFIMKLTSLRNMFTN